MTEDRYRHADVLIVSDDTEFARAVTARWQAERRVPEITLVTSAVWHPANSENFGLVILGPVRDGRIESILSALCRSPRTVICVTEDPKEVSLLCAEHPHLLVVPRQDGWGGTLILVASEALRRVEATERAQQAERHARECHRDAALGRYMLEMRPNLNDALTSVLGNADLLLLDPRQISAENREQIQTIHTMALRLHEIMQRFYSLASEIRVTERNSSRAEEPVSRL